MAVWAPARVPNMLAVQSGRTERLGREDIPWFP